MNQAPAPSLRRRAVSERAVRIDGCPDCGSQHGCERVEKINDPAQIGEHRETIRWCADCGCSID